MDMIEGVIVKAIEKYDDARGWLAELYRQDQTDYDPVMVYMSMTNPGVIRGPHEHCDQTDAFVFIGPGIFELHLWDRRYDSKTHGAYMRLRAGEDRPIMVMVPPGVVHGYKCISKTPALCINLPNQLYRGSGKLAEADEIRWEADPKSPYKIE